MKRAVGEVAVFTAVLMLFTGATVASASAVVSKVVDGDTITFNTGEKVRLLQIDTPELASSECYGAQARAALISLLNTKSVITLRDDPKLDKVDRYGRSLRYVFVGKTNINLKMVEIGAAAPYFYRGERGLYSTQFLKAAEKAKQSQRGLWKACPGTRLAPANAITTKALLASTTQLGSTVNSSCDPNYSGCVPLSSSDLNCRDIKQLGLAPVRVIGVDVHGFDGNRDGIGCEK